MGMVKLKKDDVIQLETRQDHGMTNIAILKTIITFTCFFYNPVSNHHIAWPVVTGSK